MELSKLLEKLSEKYPDEPMLDEAIAMAGEESDLLDDELDMDLANAGREVGIDDEMEPAPEEGAPEDFDAMFEEDMELAQGDDDEGDIGDDDVDVVEPTATMNKKKKPKSLA